MDDYTIEKVSWHTRVEGNPETREEIIERIWSFVDFLQRNKLVNRMLAESIQNIDDEFSIKASDLNDEGLSVVRKYEKWLTKLDKGGNPSDMRIFERELKKGGASL